MGDSRSWTDLATNIVMLSDVHIERDLHQLTGLGTAPRSLLPAFLHEATHHWCFLSPVGFLLAALELRARRRAVELLSETDTERRDKLMVGICEDLIRTETAQAFLRPIAEGLALFAEFDAMSNPKSSVMSLPLELASWIFGDPSFSGSRLGLTPILIDMLRWLRLDNRCIQRKVGVFGYPLAYEGGGYLPGYLSVRSLWLEAAARHSRLLNETDLALMYIRSFFFDDAGLVARLLDPSTRGSASATTIANHFSERVASFVSALQPSDFSAYELELLAREQRPSKLFLTSLLVDHELYD